VGIQEVSIPAALSDLDDDESGYGLSIPAWICQAAVMHRLSQGVEPAAKGSGLFTTTHWSVVLAAGQADGPEGREALEQLCRTYWYPLYVYVRRRGYGPADAQDLTQQFFARFLERGSLTSPTRPRTVPDLPPAVSPELADGRLETRPPRQTGRRGGRVAPGWRRRGGALRCRVDRSPDAGTRLRTALGPDVCSTRSWSGFARTMPEPARRGCSRRSRLPVGAGGLRVVCGARPGPRHDGRALRVAVHRLREQYRDRLRAEVAHTVSHPREVDAELRYLLTVISGEPEGQPDLGVSSRATRTEETRNLNDRLRSREEALARKVEFFEPFAPFGGHRFVAWAKHPL